jgi:putative phosphoesterase
MTDMHRIGVLSDTHIPFRATRVPDEALRLFAEARVELILHAGDLSSLDVMRQLTAFAPVEAVQGNVEMEAVGLALPIKRTLEVGGCVIGMVHNLGERRQYSRTARQEFPGARVVVFGHSHIPLIEDTDGLLLLNPGSATDRRGQPHCTVAILTVVDAEPSARLLTVP